MNQPKPPSVEEALENLTYLADRVVVDGDRVVLEMGADPDEGFVMRVELTLTDLAEHVHRVHLTSRGSRSTSRRQATLGDLALDFQEVTGTAEADQWPIRLDPRRGFVKSAPWDPARSLPEGVGEPWAARPRPDDD